ncbi:efflux RND transporter periplasmic adaptor subunit [Agrobacterium cavarae]|uniref:efflux RND transporter periplasmic adaptor subunit n=1 Tax=Agrobacterium cavarae TaxID=2528239 RepID=UPI003FD5E748
MKRKHILILLGFAVAAGGGAFVVMSQKSAQTAVAADPRTASTLVRAAQATKTHAVERSFTGTVASRVQSNLGFRVPGKIVERMVDVGERVNIGQPLMRVDEADLQLALTARLNAVTAARAVLIQAQADEKRYAALVKNGLAATPQRYEQAKAALDTATAQLAAAQAEAEVAENATRYTTLLADSDGTVVETLGDPGQVVAAAQTVVRLAKAGPREAVVWLPETLRPEVGSEAQASIYGGNGLSGNARLRQISDSADPQTRTYEARYVLNGDAASAPLGSTVTIRIQDVDRQSEVSVPVGAILDDGRRTGVWVIDGTSSSVKFAPITVKRIGEENAFVTGINIGQQVVALGAHLLENGAIIRVAEQQEGTE